MDFRQVVAKLGHTSLEQSARGDQIASRSPLANAAISLASTLGAKDGNAITDAPRSAKIPKAANDLIILSCYLSCLDPSALGDQGSNNQNENMFQIDHL
jgi:hypothetical protein